MVLVSEIEIGGRVEHRESEYFGMAELLKESRPKLKSYRLTSSYYYPAESLFHFGLLLKLAIVFSLTRSASFPFA